MGLHMGYAWSQEWPFPQRFTLDCPTNCNPQDSLNFVRFRVVLG
jgi:hypothetical protein